MSLYLNYQVSEIWYTCVLSWLSVHEIKIGRKKKYIGDFQNKYTAVHFFPNIFFHCCFLEQCINDFPHLLTSNLIELVMLLIILSFSAKPSCLPDLVWDHSWPSNIRWLTTVYTVSVSCFFLCTCIWDVFYPNMSLYMS